MEGATEWPVTGLENQGMVKHWGSIPPPSAIYNQGGQMILEELIEKLQSLPEWARNERVVCEGLCGSDINIEEVKANYFTGPGVIILIADS